MGLDLSAARAALQLWAYSLKPKAPLNDTKVSIPYLQENTTLLHLKDQFLNPFRDVLAVYSENNAKSINTLYGRSSELLTLKWSVRIVTTEL
jgi:hypothetical protein